MYSPVYFYRIDFVSDIVGLPKDKISEKELV